MGCDVIYKIKKHLCALKAPLMTSKFPSLLDSSLNFLSFSCVYKLCVCVCVCVSSLFGEAPYIELAGCGNEPVDPFLYVIETEFYRFTGSGLGSCLA